MTSVWIDDRAHAPRFDALQGRVDADVAIVGGGITGLSTALRLSQAGKRVAVVEGGRIGASNTGNSTGNLYGNTSSGLAGLKKKWGADVVREVVQWRMQALDWIEAQVAEHGIDCEFARRTLVRGVVGRDGKKLEELEREYQATAEAGLAPRWLDSVDVLPFAVHRAFAIERQAQFNPFLYAQGLARVLAARGVQLFENSHVHELDAGEGRVSTDVGELRARDIVLATHVPLGFNLVQAEMEPYREYGISARLAGGQAPPEAIVWLRDDSQSLRSARVDGEDHLVVVGAKHRVGEREPAKDYPETLREYARSHFDVADFVHEWSAQQFQSADGLPYIGRSAHHNVLIATGFSADGLT